MTISASGRSHPSMRTVPIVTSMLSVRPAGSGTTRLWRSAAAVRWSADAADQSSRTSAARTLHTRALYFRLHMRVLGSITNRIFLASALLATLSIGAAVYFVSARLTAQTEVELQRDLVEAATLVADQRQTQVENVTRTARLIADLP